MEQNRITCSTAEMVKYGFGGAFESLIMNSFFGFSMLYYTKALGLSPELAGITTFIATIWDAVTDPLMGYISDNTKSRWGCRYPYMVIGAVATLASFFFIWYVPPTFQNEWSIGPIVVSRNASLFWYLTVMNLLLRTSITIFGIPFTALGFELCADYNLRSRLQGIRNAFNMAANIAGPAMAWSIFFKSNLPDQKDTQNPDNYVAMGTAFTIAAAVCVFLLLAFMARHIRDSRHQKTSDLNPFAFLKSVTQIAKDRYAQLVFAFQMFVFLGIVLISTLQMYVFDDFMQFNGWQKSVAHGATMFGFALGSLSASALVRWLDKKMATFAATQWSALCEFTLAAIFLTGWLDTQTHWGQFPIAFVLFSVLHGAFWYGIGAMCPIAVSMIADIAEVEFIRQGYNKDASYAAMYSFALKVSTGVSGLIAGYLLKWTGFQAGADAIQTPQSVWQVSALTFILGPAICFMAAMVILPYPINRRFIEDLRARTGKTMTTV